jgi:hypothetical protein
VKVDPQYRLSEDIVFRPEASGGVVFFPDTGEMEALNEEGAFVFEAVERGVPFGAMVEGMLERFETPSREEVEADLREFLEVMQERGLIVQVDGEEKGTDL